MFLKKKIEFFKTISFRLIMAYAAVLTVFCLLLFEFIYNRISHNLHRQLDRRMAVEVQELSWLYQNNSPKWFADYLHTKLHLKQEYIQFIRLIEGPDRRVTLFSLHSEVPNINTTKLPATHQSTYHYETVLPSGKTIPIRVVYARLSPKCLIQMGVIEKTITETLQLHKNSFYLFLLVGIMPLSVLAGWVMSYLALHNIRTFNTVIENVREGNFNYRMPIRHFDNELNGLVITFNSMLDSIEKLLREQREVTDNIAHDLRSPLTRICGEIDVTLNRPRDKADYQETLQSINDEIHDLQQTISTLLDMSGMDASVNTDLKDIELKPFLEEIIDVFAYSAEDKSCHLPLDCPADITIHISPLYMKRAIANLIDNALKYTDPGGTIAISATSDQQQVVISIKDNGIGIPQREHAAVFKRFYRCEASRSSKGTGLGLSLVDAIIKAHQGTVRLKSDPGLGTEFTLILPSVKRHKGKGKKDHA